MVRLFFVSSRSRRQEEIVKCDLHVRCKIQPGFDQSDGRAGQPCLRGTLPSRSFGRPFNRLTEPSHISVADLGISFVSGPASFKYPRPPSPLMVGLG